MPKEKLVEIIMAQQSQINQLQEEIDRLKTSLHLDSQTSLRFLPLLTYSKKAKNKNRLQKKNPQKRNQADNHCLKEKLEKDLEELTATKSLIPKLVVIVEANN